jgi:hypothetical protein
MALIDEDMRLQLLYAEYEKNEEEKMTRKFDGNLIAHGEKNTFSGLVSFNKGAGRYSEVKA